MPDFRLIGLFAAILALIGGGVAGAAFLDRVGKNRAQAVEYAACRAAAEQKPGAKAPAEACAEPIAKLLVEGLRSRACEAGLRLDPDPANPGRWITPLSCSRNVQQLAASNNVAHDTVDDRDAEILRLRGSQAAAIARAERRGAQNARSLAHAQAAIAAAPRNDAGLIVCRDQCLRQLAGEDEPGSVRRADDPGAPPR
jgi:hypothetical protein